VAGPQPLDAFLWPQVGDLEGARLAFFLGQRLPLRQRCRESALAGQPDAVEKAIDFASAGGRQDDIRVAADADALAEGNFRVLAAFVTKANLIDRDRDAVLLDESGVTGVAEEPGPGSDAVASANAERSAGG